MNIIQYTLKALLSKKARILDSGFNLVNLNTDTNEIQILEYKYDDNNTKKYVQHGNDGWKKIEKIKN